jgi:lipid-binding SYLF domain-containing protein
MQRFIAFCTALLVFAVASPPAQADAKTDQRLADSTRVFEAFSNLTEQTIPTWLLQRAYGIVVVPHVIKGAFVIGGRGGKGVMAVRNDDGTWSNPVFVTLAGVNVGFQWGVQATDMILVLMSRNSVEGIAGGKVTLGADASVAAGPIGRSAAATTDATFKAQVLSYSRNEGVFAGVAIDGSVISVDDRSNERAYGVADIRPSQIFDGKVTDVPPGARDFSAALTRATNAVSTPAVEPSPAPPTSTSPEVPTEAPSAATPAPSPSATTYPMEDPSPGAPPPK